MKNEFKNADVTNAELDFLIDDAQRLYFPSEFSFLNQHMGFRPGKMHTFLATTGAGKSTLGRTLLIDVLKSGVIEKEYSNVLVWLTEEKRTEFLTEFHRTDFFKNRQDIKKRIFIDSEFDQKNLGVLELLKRLERLIRTQDIKFVLFDNITTSRLYEGKRPDEQSNIAWELKSLASQHNFPLVIFAHTNAEINNNIRRLINPNDIRGSKGIVNISEFFYIMQAFFAGKERFTTMYIEKHRGHLIHDRFFSLEYDPHRRIFGRDIPLDFERFKDIYKRKDELNG